MPPPPRIVADAGRRELEAFTLKPMDRLGLLTPRLEQGVPRSRAGDKRQVLVLKGEGGIGKSVLLGQYLEQLERDPTVAVVLVSCALIEPSADLTSFESADQALGSATGEASAHESGLLNLLSRSRAQHDKVVLLLDTLDLRITEGNVVALTRLLAEALKIGHVVATCRAYEYANLLDEAGGWLGGRLDPLDLPPLTDEEIVGWSEAYFAGTAAAGGYSLAEQVAFLNSLREGMRKRRSLQQVCSLPVRLALTCRTFGNSGHVPEELTVHGLFDGYWQRCVSAHGRQARTADGQAKETVALKLLAHVVRADGSVALHVPSACLDQSDQRGLDLLLSEGVARDRGISLEFFHQNFAEYGYARWLLRHGVESSEMTEFCNRVTAGQTALWEIAGSLLLQAREQNDYRTLTTQFSADRPPSARARTYAALHRPGPEDLNAFIREVRHRPDLLLTVLEVLADAPFDQIPAAYTVTLDLLKSHPAAIAKPATRTLEALLLRRREDEVAGSLKAALQSLIEVRPLMDEGQKSLWETLPERLIRSVRGRPSQYETLAYLREAYGDLGRQAQQAVLRAHLDLRDELSADDVTALASCALVAARPKLGSNETISLIELFWSHTEVCSQRGWTSVVAMLNERLPTGWEDGQVKLARQFGEKYAAVREMLLDSLVSAGADRTENHVNAVKQLAEADASWTADRLLRRHAGTRVGIVHTVAAVSDAIGRGGTSEQREGLIDRLITWRGVEPRTVYPAQVRLAGDDVAMHRRILTALTAADLSPGARASVIDAWLVMLPRDRLFDLTPDLRSLLSATDSGTLQRRARLEAWRAFDDADARAWVEQQLFKGPSPQVASTAAATLARTAEQDPIFDDDIAWLITLLASRHSNAVSCVAELLGNLGDHILAQNDTLMPAITERLRVTIERGEPAKLLQSLLTLFIRLDRLVAQPQEVGEHVFELLRARVLAPETSQDDRGNTLRGISALVGQSLVLHQPIADIRNRVGEVLLRLETTWIKNRMYQDLESLLVGLAHRDRPGTYEWLDELFGAPGIAPPIQVAIGRAFITLDGRAVGGRADRLRHRPSCSPEAAADLENKIAR